LIFGKSSMGRVSVPSMSNSSAAGSIALSWHEPIRFDSPICGFYSGGQMDDKMPARDLYVELLKSAITYALFKPDAQLPPSPAELSEAQEALERASDKFSELAAETANQEACSMLFAPPEHVVKLNRSNTPRSHALTPRSGIDNLHRCVETVLKEGISGDLMECGVWRGGLCIFMRGLLKAHGDTQRRVWVADSFEGLPVPDPRKNLCDAICHELLGSANHLSISLEEVKDIFRRYGLLDEQVQFVPGYFDKTLPTVPVKSLAILRIDADYYESTVPCLDNLYPKLAVGGFLILDDYGLPLGERRAVDEYRAKHGITDKLEQVNDQEFFWRKTR
jgi:O-methyltransferase